MAIEHSSIVDGERHEPKGIGSATVGQVYVADGAGSGAWALPTDTLYTTSVEDYNHAGNSLSLVADTKTKVLNDGLGSFTNTTYKIPGRANIWIPATNDFRFADAGLKLGDSVDIRFDFAIVTGGGNHAVALGLDMAVGSPNPYSLETGYREWKDAGAYNYATFFGIYIGDENTLNFPAEVTITATDANTIAQCNGWYVRSVLHTPSAT